MSTAGVKIPDMFLRAMKRKKEVMSDSTNLPLPKRSHPDPGQQKDNLNKSVVPIPNSGALITNSEPSLPLPSCEQKFSLFALLTNPTWRNTLSTEFTKDYMKKIEAFLDREYKKGIKIFPPQAEIFSAFNLVDLQKIRVVIIGQDPYHNDNQAHGMSFSVKVGVPPPPSLKNIYKELSEDIPGFITPNHGYLLGWARQGVFMLNATLTVEAHQANSHAKVGWQTFTDNVIRLISTNTEHVVFLLWGGFAQKKELLVDRNKHAVIKTAHPSPLSARLWFGCKCFSKTNEMLEKYGVDPIDWNDLQKSY